MEFSGFGYLKNLVKDITSNGKQFAVPTFEAAKTISITIFPLISIFVQNQRIST